VLELDVDEKATNLSDHIRYTPKQADLHRLFRAFATEFCTKPTKTPKFHVPPYPLDFWTIAVHLAVSPRRDYLENELVYDRNAEFAGVVNHTYDPSLIGARPLEFLVLSDYPREDLGDPLDGQHQKNCHQTTYLGECIGL
jgi:hypothetical protein